MFPIPRDPPEGGTANSKTSSKSMLRFPIPRDPPEGGTSEVDNDWGFRSFCFQFLGIPPKGEPGCHWRTGSTCSRTPSFQFLGIPPKGEHPYWIVLEHGCNGCFQFLGIPPKGEHGLACSLQPRFGGQFPIPRDPPEGGTLAVMLSR